MEEYRQPIILLFVAAYMGLCIWVGLWAMRRTKSAGDFVAGRGLGLGLLVSLCFQAHCRALVLLAVRAWFTPPG